MIPKRRHKKLLKYTPRYSNAPSHLIKYYDYQESKYWTHRKIALLVGKNKRVLEIGCSIGYLSKRMKENGCHVVGIEINQESVQIANSICDKIIEGDIENNNPYLILDEIKEKYDVIVLGDVLEHCKDPLSVLKKLGKYLNSEGYLVISVPNVANIHVRIALFFFGRFNYSNYGILDENHLRFFTQPVPVFVTLLESLDSFSTRFFALVGMRIR